MSCDGLDTWPSRHARAMDHLELLVVALARQGVDPREEPEKRMPASVEVEVLRMAARLGAPLSASDMTRLARVWCALPWELAGAAR